MRTLIVLFAFALAFNVAAQDDDYVQYELVYLKPDPQKLADFQKNMKDHNEQFHSGGPYHAVVWYVNNGPKAGWVVWDMGPCTFADLDNRPADDAHDDHWQNMVMPNVTDMANAEYWRLDEELSNVIQDAPPSKNIYVRFHKIKRGKGYLLDDELKKISEVFKNMEGDNPFWVYENMFRQGDLGRHLATITPYDNWAELDDEYKFKETFVEMYGEDAWMPFWRKMGEVMEDEYDELWSRMPDLSGTPDED